MHMSYWTNTMPSVRCWLAPVGHTGTHGGSAQCWQPIGKNVRRTSGYSPTSTSTTWRQKMPGGTAFSSWQATVHVWQPTHLRMSTTIPHRIGLRLVHLHAHEVA